MPTYLYQCLECTTKLEAFRKMADLNDTPLCEECGSETKKIMNVCNIGSYSAKPMETYLSPVTGKPITSQRQRQYDMESNGCRPWEGIKQEKKAVARQRKYNDDKLDKAVETSLNKQVGQMDSKKRKILGL